MYVDICRGGAAFVRGGAALVEVRTKYEAPYVGTTLQLANSPQEGAPQGNRQRI